MTSCAGRLGRRHVYVKIALLALAAVVAFLGAAVIGVPSSPERRVGMFISLPWVEPALMAAATNAPSQACIPAVVCVTTPTSPVP